MPESREVAQEIMLHTVSCSFTMFAQTEGSRYVYVTRVHILGGSMPQAQQTHPQRAHDTDLLM